MKSRLLVILGLTSIILTAIAQASPWIPVAHAETPSADAILAQYPDWALGLLCGSNVYSSQNPAPGKTWRYQTPIEINLNQVPQAYQATRNIEAMTSNAVTFKYVNTDPPVGIVLVTGDALTRDGEPGLGHVTSTRDPKSNFAIDARRDSAINSRLYIHLGSTKRDYISEGFRPSSIVEHELGHALGLVGHFPGFTGIEGISLEMLVALTALYRVPPGTDMSRLCVSN